MCVNIGNVSIAREQRRGNADFVQAGQSRLLRARVIVVSQILRAGGQNIEQLLLCCLMSGREKVFVVRPIGERGLNIVLLVESVCAT
jgi:hypothetical protein